MTTTWNTRFSRPGLPAVPIYVKGMRRTFWFPAWAHHLVARVIDGRPVTQRELAASLGKSLGGVTHMTERLESLGILRHRSVRGRLGYTVYRVAGDVSTNVPTTVRRERLRERYPVAVVGTLPAEVPQGEGYGAWRRLGEVLRGLSG